MTGRSTARPTFENLNTMMTSRTILLLPLTLGLAAAAQTPLDTRDPTPAATPVSTDAVKGAVTDPDPGELTTAERCRELAEGRVAWIEARCGGLEPDQRRGLVDIYENAYLGTRAWKQEHPGAGRKELKAHHERRLAGARTEMAGILTPAQREALEGYRAEAGRTRRDRVWDAARDQAHELDAIVGLRPGQRERVVALNERLWNEGKAWKEAHPQAGPDEKRKYAGELSRRRLAGYREILTDEQIDLFLAYRRGGVE